MTSTEPAVPGFLTVTRVGGADRGPELQGVAAVLDVTGPATIRHGDTVSTMWWGLGADPREGVLLSRGARLGDEQLSHQQAGALVRGEQRGRLTDALAPFAALAVERDRAFVATDGIGYRHVYLVHRPGWAAASTSLQALAALTPVTLDAEAVAVQSLLGWQLGTRTMFAGVEKLPAAHIVTLGQGRAVVESYADPGLPSPVNGSVAVDGAAALLRTYLQALLDDHPDATLQLSGGQDSRILLSAIPPPRRRGLKAMTLRVAGSEDAPIAAELARREGLEHHVITIDGLDELSPEDAYRRCRAASRQVGYMANPLAGAALTFAERSSPHDLRISGLGGEVARGFYYAGPVVPLPVSRHTAAAIARWRLFTNESVPDGVLSREFSTWARGFTVDEVHASLRSTSVPLWVATDEFYLFQRMQRWAGVTDSAACYERQTVNPMLDRRFLDLARGLRPRDKQGSRFLGRLQVALDPELARIPLDGRPPPETYAHSGPSSEWSKGRVAVQRAASKVRQRLNRARKPPAGSELLAAKVLQHWREHPSTVAALADVDLLDSAWLDAALSGNVDPGPSAVAFLLNISTAVDDADRAAAVRNRHTSAR